ncbi:hypothetical protein ACFSTI_19495 [Rhizorhabdus histidinilytica]
MPEAGIRRPRRQRQAERRARCSGGRGADGTTLWVTRWGGRLVFFAASGSSWQTQRTHKTGKTTTTITEDHAVPTGDGIDAASRAWSDQ